MRTPVIDQIEKQDTIEHINEDHLEEVFLMAQHFSKIENLVKAKIKDLFEEGALLEVVADNQTQELYIPFGTKGALEEKMFLLTYTAMVKMGKSMTKAEKKFFEVTGSEQLTKHMMRITIKSQEVLPDVAGYAYRFNQKKLEPSGIEKAKKPSIMSSKYVELLILWIMKKMPSKSREKMMVSMSKNSRYYTLQSTWKSEGSEFNDMGYIDIFIHGDTPGSIWAQSLQKGDIIFSSQEHDHAQPNIHEGQVLLLADETCFPAILRILQKWKNPTPPYLVLLSQQPEDFDYFKEEDLKSAKKIIKIACAPSEQAERVIQKIAELNDIENTWGACEKSVAKDVSKFIRDTFGLTAKNNRIARYWSL